jgi:hypothetical protein
MATFADYSAAQYDVRMVQGDSFTEPMVLEDGDGDPLDLTGYSFASQLRRTADGPLVVAFSTSVNLGTSTVTRSLSSSQTAALDGVYVHDFQWTDPSGKIRTLFAGDFEVVAQVTR